MATDMKSLIRDLEAHVAQVVLGKTNAIRMCLVALLSGEHVLLEDVPGVAVIPELAPGNKCERCWQVLPEVGSAPEAPDICNRCVDAVAHLPEAAE